ncbi:MAG: DUF4262 domain-containing protein [Haloechinothrix sp.]
MAAVTTDVFPQDIQELRDSLLAEAEERGNAIVTVAEEDGAAGYSFTACAWRKHGIPEAVVIGLPGALGPVLLDAYVDRAANGEQFEPGVRYADFFDGVPLTFEHVAKPYYAQFFGSAFAIYPDGDFPAVQIIVPTPDGHWPWSAHAPEGFAHWQPILTESGLPESWCPGQ